jgi:hypothetical protein
MAAAPFATTHALFRSEVQPKQRRILPNSADYFCCYPLLDLESGAARDVVPPRNLLHRRAGHIRFRDNPPLVSKLTATSSRWRRLRGRLVRSSN